MRTVIRNSYTPELGDYCNTLVVDIELRKKYLFDADGVFTDITESSAGGATKIVLYSDGSLIAADPELENILTFNQIKSMVSDHNNIVVVHNDNYELRFQYKFEREGVEGIWFSSETQLHDEGYLYRIMINSDNEVTNDEMWLAKHYDVVAEAEAREQGDAHLQEQIDNLELPIASNTTLGAIKVGDNLTITDDGTLSAASTGASWGGIAGTLSDQTDLADELSSKADVSSLDNYVKKTDYATTSSAGIISAGNWVTVNPTTHKLEAGELTYAQFQSAAGNTFIGKTTLQNVLAQGFVRSHFIAITSSRFNIRIHVVTDKTILMGTFANMNKFFDEYVPGCKLPASGTYTDPTIGEMSVCFMWKDGSDYKVRVVGYDGTTMISKDVIISSSEFAPVSISDTAKNI